LGIIVRKPIPVAIVAVLLVLLSLVGAASFALPEVRTEMMSPVAVALRYVGMLIAGVGLWLMFKWGYYAYMGFWALQVILFITVYGGVSKLGSPWLAVVGPIIVSAAVLPYWKQLR
jgi:hypothetical protein